MNQQKSFVFTATELTYLMVADLRKRGLVGDVQEVNMIWNITQSNVINNTIKLEILREEP